MDYVALGSTGLTVSAVCLGGLSFGEPDRGSDPWTLGEDASNALLRRALDSGITFFDTANVYSAGSSEEIIGRFLARAARRDEVVIATKVWGRMHDGPTGAGLSGPAIREAVEGSLRRLGVDYIDLYQIHRHDPDVPWEETLAALDELVRSGKVRFLGASSMFAWKFAKALRLAGVHDWTPFATMQDHYNLLYREAEREMLPLCADAGIGFLAWSPLARGWLTRPPAETTARTGGDRFIDSLYDVGEPAQQAIIAAVHEIAAERSVSPAQVALAWLRTRPGVVPIVGVTSARHLDDAVAAMEVSLAEDEVRRLVAPYRPRPHAMFGSG